MTDDTYFGPGTTPERVAEAVERAKDHDRPARPAPSRAQRDEFFGRIAEDIKRSEGER